MSFDTSFTPAGERRRVARHIARAERAARETSTARLDPLRRLVRALLLDELTRYRERGVFPRNDAHPSLTPIFVDPFGTRCAMAHLIEATGCASLVASIAATRNTATVHALSDDPRLLAWLDAAGISLDEAAAIQPGYSFAHAPADCVCNTNFGGAPYRVPSRGVLDLEVQPLTADAGVADGPTIGLVVQTHGDVGDHQIGEPLPVHAYNVSALNVGDHVLVPVSGPPWANDAGVPYPLRGYALSAQGTVSCQNSLAPLTSQQFITAVTATSCSASLEALDPAWTVVSYSDGSPGCSCAVGGGAPTAPDTLAFLGVLLLTRLRRRA